MKKLEPICLDKKEVYENPLLETAMALVKLDQVRQLWLKSTVEYDLYNLSAQQRLGGRSDARSHSITLTASEELLAALKEHAYRNTNDTSLRRIVNADSGAGRHGLPR